MKQTTTRWSVHLLALCALGPLAGYLVSTLRAADGGPDTSLLVNTTPVKGVIFGLISFALAGLIGVVGARFVTRNDESGQPRPDARAGLFAAGITLAWAAGRAGRVDVLIRSADSAGPMTTLAIEGLIVGTLGVLLAAVIYGVGKPEEQVPGNDKPATIGAIIGAIKRVIKAPGVQVAVPIATVVGAAGAWIAAASPLKGQTIGAAFVAGILAGGAGRVADQRTPAQSFMLCIGVLAVVGPLSIFIFKQGAGPVEAAVQGTMFSVAQIAPLDWVAGGMLGVPLGVAWAGSLIEKRLAEKD